MHILFECIKFEKYFQNLSSTAPAVHSMGVTHNQQFGTVSQKWLQEHN